MQAVLFAAGQSTRTYPLTLTRPKPLLPIADKTIIEHQLNAMPECIDEVILVVGYRKEMIVNQYGDQYGEIKLTYITQEEQKGTGHALLQCAANISGPFLAMNGDDIYAQGDLERLAEVERGVLAQTVDDPSRFGVLVTNDQHIVLDVVEKPTKPISNLANMGAYKFQQDIFEILETTKESERGEIEITSALRSQSEVFEVTALTATGAWLSIGYPWDILTASKWMMDNQLESDNKGQIEPGVHIHGSVTIGHGTLIRSGVVIDGPAIIGENCTIGPNAWIRPYSVIGNECKIGQGSEIKCSVLFNAVKVPHLSYIGDSVLGEDVNIGCGTITANFRHDEKNHGSMVKDELVDTGLRKLGAIIGDEVHTGINTSIYPGRKLWPYTSTLPGEVVKRDKTE
jgi:bifunctional UDP-N-acetylglucosamine pyrophosphorylase/glucosamine-1-phosphate N-acetyltransferase